MALAEPKPTKPQLKLVAGAEATDTIGTVLSQQLEVEVRRADGTPARGVAVRVAARALPEAIQRTTLARSAVFVCATDAQFCGGSSDANQFLADTADAAGRVRVRVRLGDGAARATVIVSVPEYGLVDSARYTVSPGAAVRVSAAPSPIVAAIGRNAMLRAQVLDRFGNLRSERPTLDAGPGTTVGLDVTSGVVTGREFGTQWVSARFGTLVDSTNVSIVPVARLVAWYPDGKELRLVDADGSAERTLTALVPYGYGAFPRFDAARQRVSYQTGLTDLTGYPGPVVVLDTSGAPRRAIRADTAFAIIVSTRAATDGSVTVLGMRRADAATEQLSLATISADDRILSAVSLPVFGVNLGETADLSPDGTRLAYVSFNRVAFRPELRLLTIATGVSTLLAVNALSPRWSPQGDRVAFIDVNGDPLRVGADGSLALVGADGSNLRTLDTSVYGVGLAWSPAGDYLIGRSRFGMRIVRTTDARSVPLSFYTAAGERVDYTQADWR